MMGGEATITIPGTSTKVPKWAPLAAVGVIAAFVLLRPKTAEQGDFNEEGELEEEGTGFGGFDFDDLLNELELDQGLAAPGQPMEIGYSADSPNEPLVSSDQVVSGTFSLSPSADPVLPRSDVMVMVAPGVWARPAGADRTPMGLFEQIVNPAGGTVGRRALAAHDLSARVFPSAAVPTRSIATAGPQPRPIVHGYSSMPPSTAVAFAKGQAERTYAAPSRTPTPRPAPTRAPIVFARPTSGGVQEGGGAGGPPSLPDWLWKVLRTRTGRTVAVAAQRDMERWNSSPAATWAKRSVSTVNRAFTNEASARRGKVLVSGIVTGGEAINRALGGWPYNRKP